MPTSDKFLIWDFDGTLARREGLWSGAILDALNELCPNHGLDDSQIVANLQSGFPWHQPETVRPANRSSDEWWQVLNPIFLEACCGVNLPAAQRETFYAGVRSKYIEAHQWVLFPDVLPCLIEFSERGWRHVILSNHVPELRQIVQALGIASHFQTIFNSAETGIEKPHPQAFMKVLDSLGQPSKVWMIGDNPHADIHGAKAVGLKSVLVRRSHPDVECQSESLAGLSCLIG